MTVESGRDYRVATIDYLAQHPILLGDVRAIEETGMLVRDGLISLIRDGGLERRPVS